MGNRVAVAEELFFLKLRFGCNGSSGSYIQTAVSEHFLSNSHSVPHMLLIPTETLRYESDCLRKAHEAHLIHKVKIVEPLPANEQT